MTLEEIALLIQDSNTGFMPELWERVHLFIRKEARARLLHAPPYMRDLEGDLINAGYFALVGAVKSYQPDKGASFLHWLAFYLKSAFNDALNVRTESGRQDPSRRAASLYAPIGTDTEELTLADTLTDKEAEEAYNRIVDEEWRQDIHGLLKNAVVYATEDKPEARRILLFMLDNGVSLPEAARRLGMEYSAAKAARETTRGAIVRYIRKNRREL